MNSSTALRAIDYHRRPMRVLNAAIAGLNAVGLARIRLDEGSVIDAARRATGLRDFGEKSGEKSGESFLEPMRRLIRSYETEARLNPIGRFLARTNLVRILKHRLYAQDLIKRYPEILARQLPDPIVVVGLARSGTTRLHRMLAADERFLHLKAWESVNPVPLPASFAALANGSVDPRITNIEQGLKAVLYMSPQIAAVHPLGTFEVEEEVGLIQHGFSSQLFEVQAHLPSFAEYLMQTNQNAAYEYMVVLMKIIAWFRKDPLDKPWVLKTPQHMQDLDALMHVFPGAKLICSHRDPIKAVGSACSMTWNAIVRDTAEITPEWVGQEWLNKTERMLRKTLNLRDTEVPADQQYDIQYADITTDWQSALKGVYDFLDMPFTAQAADGMRAWLARNGQHKHGEHRYELSDFGLDRDTVDQRLMFYRQRFNIPYETRNPHLKNA